MNEFENIIEELHTNGIITIRPVGGSMRGRIEDGQLVTLTKTSPDKLTIGDAVLLRWKNKLILHLIIFTNDKYFLIGNNLGKINGWVLKDDVIAKVIKVEDWVV
jgi:hypothetical protein